MKVAILPSDIGSWPTYLEKINLKNTKVHRGIHLYVPDDKSESPDAKITIIKTIDSLVPGETCIEINSNRAVFYGHKLSSEQKDTLKWLKNICTSDEDYAKSINYADMPVNTLVSRPGYVVVPLPP